MESYDHTVCSVGAVAVENCLTQYPYGKVTITVYIYCRDSDVIYMDNVPVTQQVM
jgi:hypothetical protein